MATFLFLILNIPLIINGMYHHQRGRNDNEAGSSSLVISGSSTSSPINQFSFVEMTFLMRILLVIDFDGIKNSHLSTIIQQTGDNILHNIGFPSSLAMAQQTYAKVQHVIDYYDSFLPPKIVFRGKKEEYFNYQIETVKKLLKMRKTTRGGEIVLEFLQNFNLLHDSEKIDDLWNDETKFEETIIKKLYENTLEKRRQLTNYCRDILYNSIALLYNGRYLIALARMIFKQSIIFYKTKHYFGKLQINGTKFLMSILDYYRILDYLEIKADKWKKEIIQMFPYLNEEEIKFYF